MTSASPETVCTLPRDSARQLAEGECEHERAIGSQRMHTWLFAWAIFLSAFLLFQVQPMIGKSLLPRFGGGATVWTTCMLFFQSALLAGYAYAHGLTRYVPLAWQGFGHACLLASACVFGLMNAGANVSIVSSHPQWEILKTLFGTIGPAFILLAANAPLLQSWYGRSSNASPFRLYALSNAGSLLGLLSYPFVFEPVLSLGIQQALWWSGLALFTFLCGLISFRLPRTPGTQVPTDVATAQPAPGPTLPTMLCWFLLAVVPSALLLAVTNQVSTQIAPFPLLWIIPLSLYLISFIICFDSPRWYSRHAYFAAFVFSIITLGILYRLDLPLVVLLMSTLFLALFLGCMLCHGELYRLRPQAACLTTYYLVIAAGGACGGVLVALLAPLVFSDFHELPIAFAICFAFGVAAWASSVLSSIWNGPAVKCVLMAAAAIACGMWLSQDFAAWFALQNSNLFGTARLPITEVVQLIACGGVAVLLAANFRSRLLLNRQGQDGLAQGIIAGVGIAAMLISYWFGDARVRTGTFHFSGDLFLTNPPAVFVLGLLTLGLGPNLLSYFRSTAGDSIKQTQRHEQLSLYLIMLALTLCVMAIVERIFMRLTYVDLPLVALIGILSLFLPGVWSRSTPAFTRGLPWITSLCIMGVLLSLAAGQPWFQDRWTRTLLDGLGCASVLIAASLLCGRALGRGDQMPAMFAKQMIFGGLACGGALGVGMIIQRPEWLGAGIWQSAAVSAVLLALAVEQTPAFDDWRRRLLTVYFVVSGAGLACGVMPLSPHNDHEIARARSFYGTLVVNDQHDATPPVRELVHGSISHGTESLNTTGRHLPTMYYSLNSGLGQVFATLPGQKDVACIGLGAGTIAAYMNKGDTLRFYEIDPLVVEYATNHFSYLSECPAEVEIITGDGRLIGTEHNHTYDMIVVDAFSGDSVPAHLLTREALDIYLKRLDPNGYLLIHISNTQLDLTPVVQAHADNLNLHHRIVFHPKAYDVPASLWSVLRRQPIDPRISTVAQPTVSKQRILWTDSYHSILPLIRWRNPFSTSSPAQEQASQVVK